jgi:8-amino-7-oxononanoate synthase
MLWDREIELELAERREKRLERELHLLEGSAEPVTRVDGREMLVFGSNNYLGLATHPLVVEAAVEATRRYGTGSGGSRLTTGNFALYEDLETELARFKGTEAALVFASGYATSVGVIPALVDEGDILLSDALNHASIVDGCRLSRAERRVYPHCDPDFIAFALRERRRYRRALIVTDGVFSMDGDIAPLEPLLNVAEEFDATVLVDDAHAVGVLGDRGSGTAERFGLSGHPSLIQMGTLSKALASVGGYLASSRAVVALCRQRSRSFVYSTALPASALAAARAALRVLQSEPALRTRLRENSETFRAMLRRAGFRVAAGETPILPLHVGAAGDTVDVARACFRRGLYVTAIRPPTVPEGTSRLRLSVMATHETRHLEAAARILTEAFREVRPALIP